MRIKLNPVCCLLLLVCGASVFGLQGCACHNDDFFIEAGGKLEERMILGRWRSSIPSDRLRSFHFIFLKGGFVRFGISVPSGFVDESKWKLCKWVLRGNSIVIFYDKVELVFPVTLISRDVMRADASCLFVNYYGPGGSFVHGDELARQYKLILQDCVFVKENSDSPQVLEFAHPNENVPVDPALAAPFGS